MIKVIIVIISSSLIGCTSMSESIFAGAAIGGTTGTVLGHQQGGTNQSRLTGAVVGSALGGLVGYFAHKDKIKSMPNTPKQNKTEIPESPYLTKPKVRMYWEPDQIKGNRYVEKHRVWIIEENPVWTKLK